MGMNSQGYPLWAVESDGTAYAVVGWDECGLPLLVRVTGDSGGTESPRTGQAFTFTTTDPTERPERWRVAEPYESRNPSTEWSEGDIRVVLRHSADRLDVLGATAPARRIREILESPAEPAPDDLRQRMAALADGLETSFPRSGAAGHAAARIRQELAK